MTYSECAKLLKEQDNILIVTHLRPDGDTLGSAAALCSALRRSGKNAVLFNNPEITEKYKKYVSKYIGEIEADFVIAIDVAEERMFCQGFEAKVDLCIDHHPTNPGYADVTLLRENKASCGEAVLEVIKELCGGLTAEEASLLYMAVSTDCGGFRYANTNAETFAAASELSDFGADVQGLNFELFRQVSKARICLEGEICAGLKFYNEGKLVVATVTRRMMEECGATENDCDDIAGIPGKVEGCIVSVVIRELDENKCKASLRCHPSFDVSAVAARFGGGGHKMASGCTIFENPEKCCEMLVSAINEVWE